MIGKILICKKCKSTYDADAEHVCGDDGPKRYTAVVRKIVVEEYYVTDEATSEGDFREKIISDDCKEKHVTRNTVEIKIGSILKPEE